MKDRLFNLVPPAMVAMVVLFWCMGPKALVENSWTIIVMSPLITVIVLGLEFVHERHAGWRMNWREFFTDLFYVVLSATAIERASDFLTKTPLKDLKLALGITTPWAEHMPFLAQVALAVFIVEFGQYWMHRLMHNKLPFWLVHAPHHHITQLNAAKGAVGNPIELFLISLSVLALFDLQEKALFCAFGVMTVVSTFAHANVRADPPWFYSFFFTTIQHHSLHHSTDYESTRCNYGNSLILIDRIFGTFRSGEASIVGQDDRKRLTIREQMIFPFQPLIEAYRQRRQQAALQPSGDATA
ncbi:sterol desaturase family protein [Novosphingobium rosa]|uniref:sterol desaturase family protein n=1 Tax=Novosphingobium rosa TaxID=76978 RepID=UPI00082E3C98|nr:sterol desaturase family protein [Novosphingobium rosa]